MFKALYPSATKLKYIVQTLVKVVDEIPFVATPEGLFVRTLSPDRTTMIVLEMPASAFEEYECDGEEKFVVSGDELNRIVKRGTRNDLVELALEREQKRLRITFHDKKLNVERTFYVALKEATVEKLSEPKVDLTAEIRMLTDDYKNIIRDAKLVGDELEFIVEESKLTVQSITPQKEYYNVMELDKPLISISCTENVRSKYAIDLLEATLKATTAADTVTIELGSGLPMKLTFDLPEGSKLVYWVAPRAA